MVTKSTSEMYVQTYWTDTDVDTSSGSSSQGSGGHFVYAKKISDKNWDRTPNFVRLRAEGNLPVNPFTFSWRLYDPGTFTRVWTKPGHVYTRVNYDFAGKSLSPPNDPIPSDLRFAVSASLLSKAKGNEWNVPVFVAEAGKTAEMVYSAAMRLVMMMRAAKRGDLLTFFKLLKRQPTSRQRRRATRRFNESFGRDSSKAVANLWLETTYGWVPLMSDVSNAVQTTMDSVEKENGRTISVSSSRSYTKRTVVVDDTYEVSPHLTGTSTYIRKTSVRAMWVGVASAADLPGRFGLINLPAVAWEVTGLSFVVDWFVPIGDYLSGLDASLRFSHKTGYWGMKDEVTAAFQATGAKEGGWSDKASGSAYAKAGRVTRDPMTSIPQPKLSDIRFDPSIGAKRATSAIALLRQVFK